MDKTSRFRSISQPCSFTRANRFPDSVYSSVTKGPGQYDTAISTLKKDSVSFAKSLRPPIETQIGVGADGPGPGLYEVRGINRKGDPTLDPRTCKQGGRHGWYYENREAGRKPGPGTFFSITAFFVFARCL